MRCIISGGLLLLSSNLSADACIYGGCTPEQQALENIGTQLDDINRQLRDMQQQRIHEQTRLQMDQMQRQRAAAIEQERQYRENMFRGWAPSAPSQFEY